MTVSSLEDIANAKRQTVKFAGSIASNKTRAAWYSRFSEAGGTIGNTTTGLVPVAGDTVFPRIVNSSLEYYIKSIRALAGVSSGGAADGYRVMLYDRLWHAGTVSTSAAVTTTFSAQPSYLARLPSADYFGLLLCIEVAGNGLAFSGSASYTNQSGVSGRTTAWTMSTNTYGIGILPMQAGDSGVQRVDSVTVTAIGGNGNFSVFVMRPLALMRVKDSGYVNEFFSFDLLGLVRLYQTSALELMYAIDSNASGWWPQYELDIELMELGAADSGADAGPIAPGSSAVTWDPANKGTSVTLSNGNLTASYTSGSNFNVRGTVGHSSGKYYCEMVLNPASTGDNTPQMGVCNGSFGVTGSIQLRGSISGWCAYPAPNMFTANNSIDNFSAGSMTTGEVVGVAVDIGAGKIWFSRNGIWSGVPATGTTARYTNLSGTIYPACKVGSGSCDARFNPASWAFACPSGFGPW